MFEKSLNDLIKGLRVCSDEAQFVSQCMEECRKELRVDNIEIKANAVAKLTHMQMLGYDITWAAFNVVEVMSSKKFTHKRIGYLAAAQSFHKGTDVLMLTTNMIKKDLSSQSLYEAGVAIGGFACFVTPDLARDLANDIVSLTASSRPYIRKRATLMTYKIFLNFPEALRPTFQRLKDKLEDPEPSVQCAAVNVICELACKNPKNYLSLAPVFFKLLTESPIVWLRIKVIKLFAALAPLEPRLAKKLIEPLIGLINSDPPMSLLYECLMAIIIGISDHLPSVQLCVEKLKIFIQDQDQNLKYLGLQAMSHVIKIQPKFISQHRDLIIACLEDADESIRRKALDLVAGMVNKKNLHDIVNKLKTHVEMSDGEKYRDEVVGKIIFICSQETYQHITSFEWYMQVLVDLTRVEGTKHGKLIAGQLMDVAIRVKAVRPTATKMLVSLLSLSHLHGSANNKNGVCEVLYAAAWVAGEFAVHIDDPYRVIDTLSMTRVTHLPGHIQAVYVQAVLKVYGYFAAQTADDDVAGQARILKLRELIVQRMPLFTGSGDLEVQERAVTVLETIKYAIKKREQGINIDSEIADLFVGDLNPVAAKAQRKVPIPEGLDLDKWIHEMPSKEEEKNFFAGWDNLSPTQSYGISPTKSEVLVEDDATRARKKEERRLAHASNPNYLGNEPLVARLSVNVPNPADINVDEIPSVTLDVNVPITFDVFGGLAKKEKKVKLTKKEKKKMLKKGIPVPPDSSDDEVPVTKYDIVAGEEMPEGALQDSDGDDTREAKDPHKALNIDLDAPLEASEALPVASHRVTKTMSAKEAETLAKKKKKDEKERSKEHTSKKSKSAKSESTKAKGADKEHQHTHVSPVIPAATPSSPPIIQSTPIAVPSKTGSATPLSGTPLSSTPTGLLKKDSGSSHKEKKAKKSKDSLASPLPEKIELGAVVREVAVLAKNSHVTITLDTLVGAQTGNHVCLVFSLTNTGSAGTLKKMAFKISETDNVTLAASGEKKPGHPGFDLEHASTKEYRLALAVKKIGTPQVVAGSFKYTIGDTETKLKYSIPLPCSAFVFSAALTTDEFAALLKDGGLGKVQSLSLPRQGKSLTSLLQILCGHVDVGVVEMASDGASLYGQTTEGKHICLLAKATNLSTQWTIDAKASIDSATLAHILTEIKQFFL